jgi:hypothetical protein
MRTRMYLRTFEHFVLMAQLIAGDKAQNGCPGYYIPGAATCIERALSSQSDLLGPK